MPTSTQKTSKSVNVGLRSFRYQKQHHTDLAHPSYQIGNQFTMTTSNPSTEGLCYVTSAVRNPHHLSDAKFNDFYDNEHVPDILRYGFSKLALRYKNADPESKAAYLALYPLDDVAKVSSPTTAEMMEECRRSRILDGQDHHELIDYDVSAWSKIQTFEGHGHSDKTGRERGQTLVAVFVEPGDGAEAEAEVDTWYRKQHLDVLSMCRGYRRSTRYRLAGEGGEGGPRLLALHEYACAPEELPTEQIQQSRETEWAREVLGNLKGFEREVWRLVGVQGVEGMKL